MTEPTERREQTDEWMVWLLLAVGLCVLAFVPSVFVFVITYLRGLGLHAELLSQKIQDPDLVAAAQANNATCYVAALVTVVSGSIGLVSAVVVLFRWQRPQGPNYPMGG